jgi:hypothetical protein
MKQIKRTWRECTGWIHLVPEAESVECGNEPSGSLKH